MGAALGRIADDAERSVGDASPTAPERAGATENDRFHQYLLEANRSFCDQIRVADQKAAYVFTFVLALLVWSSETRKAFDSAHLSAAGVPTLVVTVVLLTSVVTTLLAAIFVIMPRSRPGVSVLFWGAWPDAGSRLTTARNAADFAFIDADLIRNTETLSRICRIKYRFVALAFRSLVVLVVCYLSLLVIPT